jgi:NAD(P)-dependent dehydrogenase (short-subunit alcohol dehydrogenase family)
LHALPRIENTMTPSTTHAHRVAVVTGAARGIGAAIAQALASRGAMIVAADLTVPAATVEAIGTNAIGVAADVSDPQGWAAIGRAAPRCRSSARSTWSSTTRRSILTAASTNSTSTPGGERCPSTSMRTTSPPAVRSRHADSTKSSEWTSH